MVEQWNRDGGTVEQRWWNSGLSDAEAVKQSWWNSGTEIVEHWNISWWNSRTSEDGKVEHLMVEQ